MASLLLWWSPSSAPIDDTIWRRMIARAAQDAGHPISSDAVVHGPDFRALGLRTLGCEPIPLRRLLPDRVVLAALRHEVSDAELVSRRFSEPAAVVHLDPSKKRLRLTRDLLGQKHLVWTRVPGGILVATREESLFAHPDVGAGLDEAHIAAMMASVAPDDVSTPFAEIRAVAPGMTVELTSDNEHFFRESLEPCEDVAAYSDIQLAERFRELLEDSVHRAARGANRIGLSISSGLDAATIAAILMSRFSGDPKPAAVCYSYSVESGADFDERPPARQLCLSLGIEFDSFDASTISLAFALDRNRTVPIGSVLENPYREIKTEVYRRLASHGIDVALVGHGADQFAMTPANWLWSAWADGRFDWIQKGLNSYLTDRGLLGTLRHPSLRRFVKYLLLGKAGLTTFRAPDIIPKAIRESWRESHSASLARFAAWPDPARAELHFNSLEVADYALEVPISESYGLDIRCPFRDWDLVRFVLSTPSYLMAGPVGYKWMQKKTASRYLSDEWIERPKRGDLSPLWRRHFELRKTAMITLLRANQKRLNRFIKLPSDTALETMDLQGITRLVQFKAWLDAAEHTH